MTQKEIYFLVALTFIAAPTIFLLSEKLKETTSFCIQCHAGGGKALHEEKYNAFTSENPSNMSAAHRAAGEKAVRRFACSDCHTGRTFGLKVRVTSLEIYNTFYHLLAGGKEPKYLNPKLMPDSNCTFCHKPKTKGDRKSFHTTSAHMPAIKTACILCHQSHKEGDPEYYFINMQALLAECRSCHKSLSPAVLSILPEEKLKATLSLSRVLP